MASKDWQHPYVNIFKHVRVEEWRRSSKVGDVSSCRDKTLKCPVFLIRGPISSNNYILVPKNSSQSLGLKGRFFYLLFRPSPEKYFEVHLDVAAEEGHIVRISFSNKFKDFKSTATCLQFPFLCGAVRNSVYYNTSKSARHGLVGPAPTSVPWTCLMLDLQQILSFYINRCYNHLKSIKLCANMLVKNMFTSDLLLEPGVSFSEAKLMGLASSRGTGPIPRDMSFPVRKGESWHDLYDFIRFPSEGTKLPFDSIHKGSPQRDASEASFNQSCPVRAESSCVDLSKVIQDRVSLIQQITSKPPPLNPSPVVANLPELGVVSTHHDDELCHGDGEQEDCCCSSSHQLASTPPCEDAGVHVYLHSEDGFDRRGEESEEELIYTLVPHPTSLAPLKATKQQKLLPDPILKLNRIIGFGGGTTKCAVWTRAGDEVVYPCHAVIVSMNISSNKQRFFLGHTEKVSALAFNGNTTLLASAQTGAHSVVRVWNYHKGNCLALIHAHSLSCLSFSYSGGILCGVGKDRHNKTVVMVWNTLNINKGVNATVIAKAQTDVDICTMKITFFDDTRLVSCGRDNVRLWRVRNGALRSCPVNLGKYHSLDFTDVCFEEGNSSNKYADDRTLFVSSRSGHIFEIDYNRVVVTNVRRLLPAQQQHEGRREKWTFNTGPGIAINSISVSSSFCATGSEDGFLRLWPLDFSSILLEAEHEGPVSVVSISCDGLRVLSATSSGNLGFLDVNSRGYNTLMRSHTDTVLGFSVDGLRQHLTTASCDGTVRIWNMETLHQLYDFESDDSPCSVAFHPTDRIFSCGFNSGIIRVFDMSAANLLAEYKQHRGEVVGLTFSPDGGFMYSADSQGSLALYNSVQEDRNVVRVVFNVVARGSEHAPDALTVSSDSLRLAFVGPTEYIVTIADARTLDELLHVDVSILDAESSQLDSALKVCFSPASTDHLLVTTSANKILWVCTKTGRRLREVSKVHKQQCSSLAVSLDNRFLLTAGQNTVKVWDYNMKLDVNSQMFIGHSRPIRQVGFTPDQLGVISVGDAIFLWDFLADPVRSVTDGCHSSPLRLSATSAEKGDGKVSTVLMSGGVPRQAAPLPSSPPARLDASGIDLVDQGALGPSSFCDDTPPIITISAQNSSPDAFSESRSAISFLKVTDMDNMSPPNISHKDSGELKEKKPLRPDCYRHFIPRLKNSSVDQSAAAPQPQDEGIKLKAVIGYNGNGRGNMVWSPLRGFFAYSCGCVVVVEYLHTGRQKHLRGHREEISCLAVTNDAQTLASAAGGHKDNRSVICVWDVQNETCRKTISHHRGAVQSLAFSRDDRFFLSVGDFSEPEVALWSCKNFQLLSSVSVSDPVHDAAFSPAAASQMAFVGSRRVYFCVIHSQGLDVNLKVQRVNVPADLGEVEVTTLCYHMDSILFTGTSGGHVCAWDVNTQHCFMTWEADQGEIGVLLCRGNQLLTGSSSCWLRRWEVDAVQSLKPKEAVCHVEDSGAAVVLDQEMKLDGTTVSAAFDQTLDMGIAGTSSGTLWYINWSESSNVQLVSGHKSEVNDVVFSSDESHFATCCDGGSVRVWSSSSLELVVQFQVLNQACGCVCWSPSASEGGSCVAAGYGDGTLRIFRLSSTKMERKLHPHQEAVTAVQYSAHGHVILSAGANGLVAVNSPVSGTTIRVIRDHKGATITSIQCVNEQCKRFGLEGSELWLAAGADRRVSVWAADWAKEKCDLLDWLSFPAPTFTQGDCPPPSMAAFCPADHNLVVYTGFGVEKELSFYSLRKKQIIRRIALPHWASCFSLSSNTDLVAVGSKERVLKLIQTTSGRFQDFLHSDSLQSCRFSPSGTFLFSVAFNEIFLWEVHGF